MAPRPKKKPTPTFSPEVAAHIKTVGGSVNDNGHAVFTPEVLQKLVGPKKFEEMVAKATEQAEEPETFRDILYDNWDNGWRGKTAVILSFGGLTLAVGGIAEGIGAAFEIPQLRWLTWASAPLHR